MKSSQALTQSVFSNLKHLGKFHLLQGIRSHDDDIPIFEIIDDHTEMKMEWEVDFLDEPSKTTIDVAFFPEHRIAVECKLTEPAIGHCSKPDYCNGTYSCQQGRKDRCSLTSIGIKYWQFIPLLFEWSSDRDYNPCPIRDNYQLVRNILAASIKNRVVDQRAIAVMVFDERNPEYVPGKGGVVDKSFTDVRKALRLPWMLQRVPWQSIVKELKRDPSLEWLIAGLNEKFGL